MHFLKFFQNNTFTFYNRRGISQVIGSLLMLAIVIPIGTVILFNGTSQINAFNNELSTSLEFNNDGIQEDIVFEHVRFDPLTKNVMLSIRNTGTVETTIDRISILDSTNQKLVFKMDGMSSFAPKVIPLKNSTDITIEATNIAGINWKAENPDGKDYRISVITTRGNFFDTIARGYNT